MFLNHLLAFTALYLPIFVVFSPLLTASEVANPVPGRYLVALKEDAPPPICPR